MDKNNVERPKIIQKILFRPLNILLDASICFENLKGLEHIEEPKENFSKNSFWFQDQIKRRVRVFFK
jgi:hypothetical protein